MPPGSLVLLLVTAVFHACVNLLLKQARDKLAFTWWLLGTSSVLWAPLLWFGGPHDATGWALVTASGLLEAAYFVTLSRAYSLGELSQVYPIARGSAPVFLAVWSGLFLHEERSAAGLGGIAAVVAGIYLINLPSFSDWKRPLAGFREAATRWALLTGLFISAYTTVDKVGIEHVDPRSYLVLILSVGWLVLTPQWLHPGRRQALLDEVMPPGTKGLSRVWLRVLAGAVLGNAAYLIVLFVMRGNKVSYVAPVREVSVVFGAWVGVRFYGERGGGVRVVASVLIVLGIFLIGLAGYEPAASIEPTS
jgi:drug/metabolite transporter (DMT)-like permease